MKIKSLFVCAALLFAACSPLRAQDSTIQSTPVYRYAGVPANGTSEVDTLTIQTSTSAGTFTITVADGRTTAPITWSATDATLIARIDAALEALSVVGTGGVVVTAGTGTSGIGTYLITMSGKNAVRDFPALSIGTNALTGGAAPTLTTTTPGVAATWGAAPTGTVIINSSTGAVYSNTSTTAFSPTWVEIVGIAVATSADLRGMLSDETGTGVAVFATSPTVVSPVISTGLTASGSAANTFAGSTGTFVTSTGANTISGDATVAANKDLLFTTGDSAADFSLGTGITKTTSGLFTATGPIAVSTGTLSGPGAISVVKGTTKVTTTGVADALTLANGTDGQIITIVHDVDGGSAVLTPTTKSGYSTITFTDVGETATLQYTTTRGWVIVALNAAVAAAP